MTAHRGMRMHVNMKSSISSWTAKPVGLTASTAGVRLAKGLRDDARVATCGSTERTIEAPCRGSDPMATGLDR
jgi:hypothetical protein